MTYLRIVNASQGPIHRFESLKRKLYNCNASIYFNRQCLKRKLTQTYAKIKVPNTFPAYKHTQHKVTIMRIKDEIKYLHTKKQKLNALIYQLHLDLANTWKNLWQLIHHTIEDILQREIRSRYLNLDRKLNHLAQSQTKAPLQKQNFYPRVINSTDIAFSEQELVPLQKGPKYNLHNKPKKLDTELGLRSRNCNSTPPLRRP
jgi:hypothetical protein